MKHFIYFALIAMLTLSFGKAMGQENSVELQDGGGNFISSHNSIQAAYNAIPGTISQAYIIEILAIYDQTNETFPISLSFRDGSSSTNTITLRPDAGNSNEVIAATSSTGIIYITNADYVIIDGRPGGTSAGIGNLEIRNNSTGSSANTIDIFNGSSNNVIRYCNVVNSTQNTTGPRAIELGVSTTDVAGNSNNVIEYCQVTGGRTGVGSSGTTANPNRNNRVSNNSITGWGFAGVWALTGTQSMIIENNVIDGAAVNVTNPSGISLQNSADSTSFIIRNNKITAVRSSSTSTSLSIRGIIMVSAAGTGSNLEIYNNFISLIDNNNNAAWTFGIYTVGTAEGYNVKIHYNTIHIGGTQTGGVAGRLVSAGIVKQSTFDGIVYSQKNNICINTRTGGTSGVIHAGMAFNAPDGLLDVDYNCYFATGSSDGLNSYPVTWDSVGYDDASTYAGISGEDNVRFKNVTFVSGTDLHLDGSSIQDPDLSARPVTGITTDIDGDTRSTSFPYRGADESTAFTFATLNLTINLEAYSPVQDTVVVSLRSASSPYNLIETQKAYLSSGGSASFNFAKAVNGVPYYIVVNHRNSVDTWSKSGGEMFSGGTLTYDFTTAASQAFGSNQVLVGSEYSIYTGDVNKDSFVDAADVSLIDNAAFNFESGYIATDLNGDMSADGTDLAYADNNAYNFVGVIAP